MSAEAGCAQGAGEEVPQGTGEGDAACAAQAPCLEGEAQEGGEGIDRGYQQTVTSQHSRGGFLISRGEMRMGADVAVEKTAFQPLPDG